MSSKQGLVIVATCLLFLLIFDPVTAQKWQPREWLSQQLEIEKKNGDNSAKISNMRTEDLEEMMKKFFNSLEKNQQIAANEAKSKFESHVLNDDHTQLTACDQCESKLMKYIDEKYENVLILHKEDMYKLENRFTEQNNRILENSQKLNFLQTFYNYSNAAVTKIVRDENERQEQLRFQETLSSQVVTNEANTLMEQSAQSDRQLSNSFSELSAEQQQEHIITLNGTSQTLRNFYDAALASSNNIKSQLRLIAGNVTSQKSLAGLLLAIQESKTKLPGLEQRVCQLKQNVEDITSAIKKIVKLPMVELGGRLYHFSKDEKTWSEARTFCRSHGLELAALETAEENLLVVGQVWEVNPYQATWLGGTDEGTDGHWRWDGSGNPLNFSNWRSGEPDSGKGENCMVICDYDFSRGVWCGLSCTASVHFVCEEA